MLVTRAMEAAAIHIVKATRETNISLGWGEGTFGQFEVHSDCISTTMLHCGEFLRREKAQRRDSASLTGGSLLLYVQYTLFITGWQSELNSSSLPYFLCDVCHE